MGDNASFGYLQAIETAKVGHKVWFIGDIGNMTPIDKQHVLLSSVLWNFTKAFKQAIQDINARHLRHARLQPDPRERRHLAAEDEVHPGRASGARSRRRRAGSIAGKIKVPVAHEGVAGQGSQK